MTQANQTRYPISLDIQTNWDDTNMKVLERNPAKLRGRNKLESSLTCLKAERQQAAFWKAPYASNQQSRTTEG